MYNTDYNPEYTSLNTSTRNGDTADNDRTFVKSVMETGHTPISNTADNDQTFVKTVLVTDHTPISNAADNEQTFVKSVMNPITICHHVPSSPPLDNEGNLYCGQIPTN